MVEEITIEKLYEELYDRLNNMKGLVNMYIGKTQNVEQRRKEHKKDYTYTKEIAYGNATIINKAEKYLISKFKQSPFNCKNIGEGGEGDIDADKLYISYNYDKKQMKSMEELEDDELDIISYKLKN